MNQVVNLPYLKNALEPIISRETVDIHYEKHHKGYAKKLDELLQNTNLKSKKLNYLLCSQRNNKIFNMAAQVYNHNWFWYSMKPINKNQMSSRMEEILIKEFGSVENFKKKFVEVFMNQFGSGWCWVIYDGKKMDIVSTSNADLPNGIPLLVCDIWEHAYYLDYKNEKEKFVKNWFHILNWEFLEHNYLQVK